VDHRISLQEWEQSGWKELASEGELHQGSQGLCGSHRLILGYFVLIYFLNLRDGQAGWIPVQALANSHARHRACEPVAFCTVFMVVRVTSGSHGWGLPMASVLD